MKLSEEMKNKTLLSFELFPPKTEKGLQNLPGTIDHLMKYNPSYISCTYGAGGGNVKGGGILGSQSILDIAGSGRGERIRRDGGDDNQVNILRLQPAGFQSALGGLRPHMGSVLVRGGDAAFHNARAFNNPFVGSVHHLLQIRIGQAAFRNIGTRTDNLDGQSFKGNIRMCGHSFGRMMNRKRPDVLCGNSLKERGPDDQHKTQGSFHVVNE